MTADPPLLVTVASSWSGRPATGAVLFAVTDTDRTDEPAPPELEIVTGIAIEFWRSPPGRVLVALTKM